MAVQIAKLELEGSQHNELFVGNLKAVRDYLNVKDVVRAYRMLLEHTTKPGEIYNICSGKPIQINDLLKHLLSFSYRKIIVKQDPKRLRPSDVPVMVGSSTKLTKLTGWTPVFDLESTLSETLDYWRQELKSSPSKI
jgi:GDP-4-dehydro-6-deoxy-D-mannose reductase